MNKTVSMLFVLMLTAAGLSLNAAQDRGQAIPESVAKAVKATDYASVRVKPFPVAMQCWTYRRFTFLETMEKVRALGIDYLQAYPGQPLGGEFGKTAFNHGLSPEVREAVKKKLREAGLSVVAYGVVDAGRTEAEMRRVFDFARDMGIRTIVCEPQDGDFEALEKLVKEYDIRIAIHNHPAPSSYAYPGAALQRVRGRDERIGVCADTGHWMRQGLDPVECLRLLEGRVNDVHLKDRSDFGTGPGAFDVAWGRGKAGIRRVLAELTLQDFAGFLTIEYENEKEVLTPEPAVKDGLEFVKKSTYFEGWRQLLRRYGWRYEKHGWNHYGPGHFELDERTGVLKSQGGMGLLWYSARKFRDFVLELDYKCSRPDTNSGVFIRVPEVPVSDDYIYHAFEIQINDAGRGIHRTAAVYDAEAPREDAWLPAGEWNHMKITCRGKRIQVEVNGKQVLDWSAEPRGKVRDFALEGYVGLQNHDSLSPVFFKDVFIKEL